MEISSRTPEGFPTHCLLCGAETNLEFSDPGDDAPCPVCGTLLLKSLAILEIFKRILADQLGVSPDKISTQRVLKDFTADSLEVVELLMEFEEEFDLNIPDDEAARIDSVQKLIRYLSHHLPDDRI